MTILDEIREHAERRPEHAAIIVDGDDETVSYTRLLQSVDAQAQTLRERGLRRGARCGLLARQGRGFVESALAIMAAEACLVPIPDDYAGAALDDFVTRARLHHLLREDSGTLTDFADVPAVDGNEERSFRALRPAYLRFTSGTTSRRKGVIIGHDAIRDRLRAANRGLEITPDDRVLWLLPMAHHFVVSILLYLSRGATLLLPAGSLARHVLDFAARAGATVFYASPYHYQLLGKDTSGIGLESVRLAVSTAEGLRADVAARFAERYGFPVSQALGIIEVGLPVLNRTHAAEKPRALGKPLADYDVWLRGDDGRPVVESAPDRTGEICIRGPGMFDAYLDPWTPAREVLEPDGFRTGDQGWFDDDGDLWLVGRHANRINMAGMKFFAEEVEAVLDAHPAIRRSRVLAREHAHLGEIPIAEIVPTDPESTPTRKDLTVYCRERLPAYKIPRAFEVVPELPMTATGKLARSSAVPASRGSKT